MIKSPNTDIEIPKTSIFDFTLPEEQLLGDKTVFVEPTNDVSLTNSQLPSVWLRKYHNIGRRDRVLILSRNSLVYPILFLGTSAAGACASLANPG
ncbi:hypothetical protein E3P92_03568 [Wallemia ichthyophaga]|uniref:AMP-dependent synthetase/ligase domain-containing protein n=1 Tax=Wallemia ichthyophaga TaxID=245174 RepID=A0A4T0EXB0_WALIC|nr:hypothetical protein E3P91_03619 [Wallemia ichthyophaga]TIA78976.1 hypothetical protein E3P98_03575 [Wallemia ichthyophaga]TIA88173.1 hypothetical protein E3P97_03631 [Wallemia ichthyophaga]TIA94779.1 hypothetical protein E3P96_04025 [Wallemia ichthyophaga]TIA95920.1 hypothetical protein E3P95_03505 [Wallemia ichthyophaga]